jgi:hypothetical protein
MPGSVTIGHFHQSVTLGHDDAERLADVLSQMSLMLEMAGPNRITDQQVSALCEGRADRRAELSGWARNLARHVQMHL